jgi:hypothetical protein
MQKHTYFWNVPETIRTKTGRLFKYYIPAIDEHISVCDSCRLKHWESILLKKWKLVAREPQGQNRCMACAPEESKTPPRSGPEMT